MTCTVVSKPTSMIVCRRFDHKPIVNYDSVAPPQSLWQPGKRVRHVKYGEGTITQRNYEAVNVAFDDPAAGQHAGTLPAVSKTFLLAYVGKTMEVLS